MKYRQKSHSNMEDLLHWSSQRCPQKFPTYHLGRITPADQHASQPPLFLQRGTNRLCVDSAAWTARF